MYGIDVMEHFKKVPVFSLADVSQIIRNRIYAKKFLHRMVEDGRIKRIMRDHYTVFDDAFLVSTFLVKPSYISSVSSLSFHHLITQIPSEVFCFTTKRARSINFVTEINFFHTRRMFGFRMEKAGEFHIPVARPEKAVMDSFGVVPVSVFEEAFENLDSEVIAEYVIRTGNGSLAKRIGFLAERNGVCLHDELASLLNGRYVRLDPLAKKSGSRDKKWKVVVNG